MRTQPQTVAVGDKVVHDLQIWTVLALVGATALQLRSRSTRQVRTVLIEALLEDPDFSLVTEAPAEVPEQRDEESVWTSVDRAGPPVLLDELPAKVRSLALERERLLLTMLTGYPDGVPDGDEPPDPEYAACSSRRDAFEVLARRACTTTRTAYRWRAAYRDHGVAGLVDDRVTNPIKGLSNIDSVVQACMVAALDQLGYESKVTNKTLRKRVEALLAEAHEKGPAALPPESSFNRYLKHLREASRRHLTTKSQQGAKNAPQGVNLVMPVTRPFEYTLWDSTPLDLLTFDPTTGKAVRVWLTIVLDLFSRSLVGWLFTSETPTAADMSRLLYRVASPKPMMPHWPEHARWRYPSVPEWMAVEGPHAARGCGDGIAGIPFGMSETVVIDHGRTFKNVTVREAARIMKSNIQLARVLTPTDKAHVEAAFGRIREQFVERYPAYTGPDVASRGDTEHVEAQAHVFLWELDEDFAEWVACDYQTRTHRGLVLRAQPKLEMSPNEMLDLGWTRAGFIRVPPDRQRLIDLLPTEWRTVQQYGVEIETVRFDAANGQDDVLQPYRNRKSPYRGVSDVRGVTADGKWKVKRDPSTNRVWFWACDLDDPTRGTYVPLYYRGQPEAMPFSDKMVVYAKEVLLGRGGNTSDPVQVMDTLDRIMARIRQEQALPVQERRLAAQLALKTFMSSKDYAAAGIDLFSGNPTADQPPGQPSVRPGADPSAAGAAAGQSEVVTEEAAAAHTYDPADVERLPTAEVTDIDFFGDWDGATRDPDADLGGHEDLSAEDDG